MPLSQGSVREPFTTANSTKKKKETVVVHIAKRIANSFGGKLWEKSLPSPSSLEKFLRHRYRYLSCDDTVITLIMQ